MKRYIYKATKDYEIVAGHSVVDDEPYLVRKGDSKTAYVAGKFKNKKGEIEISERAIPIDVCMKCLKFKIKL